LIVVLEPKRDIVVICFVSYLYPFSESQGLLLIFWKDLGSVREVKKRSSIRWLVGVFYCFHQYIHHTHQTYTRNTLEFR